MNRGRAVMGLSLLCALVLGAVTAPTAFAAGTTAFTCAPGTGTEGFKDRHCDEATKIKDLVKFVHQEIKQETPTGVTTTNAETKNLTKESTPVTLKAILPEKISGHFKCKFVDGKGTITNFPGPPMWVFGEGINLTFSECAVEEPEPTKCKLTKNEIIIKGAMSTTPTEKMTIEYVPEGPNPLITFKLEGCKNPNLNKEYKVTGTMTTEPPTEGVTLHFTEESTKELSLSGAKATLIATVRMFMEIVKPGEKVNEIVFTTTAS